MPSTTTPHTTFNSLCAGYLPTHSKPDQTPTVSASSASAPMSTTQNPSANPSTLSATPTTQAPDITAMANAINTLVQSNVPSRVKLREPDTFDGSDPKKLCTSCFITNSTSKIAQIFSQMELQRSIMFFPI